MVDDTMAIGTATFFRHMEEMGPPDQVQSKPQLTGNAALERFLISELSGTRNTVCRL
jgi:hypothetical protein